MIGEKILNYQVEKLLGEGGIGQVYLATHIQLGRKVAIKVLNPNLVNHQEVKDRFRQEAATLSSLQHLNIVTLYDYLENEKGLFLIMEYVEGHPLDEFLQKVSGPLSENRAIDIFNQILDGLAYAHARGIVHRDIKPSNILIGLDGQAKILDFGIAKILKSDKPAMTKAGARVGTVLYMSPEQVKGDNLDARSDIYALGVTLWEMLTAKTPYNETIETEFSIYNKILNEPLPRAKDFYPAVPDYLQKIIDVATAKNPQERYQSCEELKRALLEKNIATKTPTTSIPQTSQTTNTLTPNLRENISKKIEKKKERSFTILYVLFSFLLLITSYLIYIEITKTKKYTPENEIVKQNNTIKNTDDKQEHKKEEKKEKNKTEEELELDSLERVKDKIEEKEEIWIKAQKSSLNKSLIVADQLESEEMGEYVINVKLTNQRTDTKFKDIIINVIFSDKNTKKELKKIEKEITEINEGQTLSFQVKETFASEVVYTCKLKSATPVGFPKSEELDSLSKEKDKIKDRIKELKEKINNQ
jgi:serine/threonine protein kinase